MLLVVSHEIIRIFLHTVTIYFHLSGPRCKIEIKEEKGDCDKLSFMWDEPNCDGWTEGITYSTELECVSPNCSTVRKDKVTNSSVTFSNLTMGIHKVTVTSRNPCGETTSSSLHTYCLACECDCTPRSLSAHEVSAAAFIFFFGLLIGLLTGCCIGCCCSKQRCLIKG